MSLQKSNKWYLWRLTIVLVAFLCLGTVMKESDSMDFVTKFWQIHKRAYRECGIERFHRQGYYGERVNIGNIEQANVEHPYYDGMIKDPLGRDMNDRHSKYWHGDKTSLILHAVAPKSKIYLLDKGSGFEDKWVTKSAPLIKEQNITVCTSSVGFSDDNGREKVFKDLYDNHFFKQCVLAGNYGYDVTTRDLFPNGAYSISATGVLENGEHYHHYYSQSATPRYMGAYCPYQLPQFNDLESEILVNKEGTSFSTPFFAGMIALVDDFFIDKVGRPLHRDEMELFVKDNAVIYSEKGDGTFILPDPRNIDVNRYLFFKVKEQEKPDDEVEKPKEDVVPMNKFIDVKDGRYSTEAIYSLVEKGIMSGFPDGRFKPYEPLTREQFAYVINQLIIKYLD